MDGNTEEVNLRKVGLTEQCLKDFSLIIPVCDAKTVTNGIILHLKGKFSIQDLYKIIEKLLPVPATTSQGEPSALNENSFRKRLKVLEVTVKKLNKSKKNHDKVNDLLAEPFNLAPSLVVGKELTPRKRKLVEEKKHVEGEYKKSQAAVKKLKLDHNEQVSHHAAETKTLVRQNNRYQH